MKILLAIGGAVVLVVVIAAVVASSATELVPENSTPGTASNISKETVEQSVDEMPQYDVLKHKENGDSERWINASLFVDSQDQELLKQIAFQYRKDKCEIQCNV